VSEPRLSLGERVRQSWDRRSTGRRDRRQLVKLLWRVDARRTMACLLATVLQAVAAVSQVASSGLAIGLLPLAVHKGGDPALADRLVWYIVLIGVAFAAQFGLIPVLLHLSSDLGRRVDGALRERLIQAVGSPSTVAHLENPVLLTTLRQARAIADGDHSPGQAVGAYFRTLGTWFVVISQAVVVAVTFDIRLALLLSATLVALRYRLVNDLIASVRPAHASTPDDLTRADYIRELTTSTFAAQEIRLFGLGGWVQTTHDRLWHSGMQHVWTNRKQQVSRPWAWSIPWGLVSGLALFTIGRAAMQGSLGLASAAIAFQASLSAVSVWIHPDDLAIAYGARSVPAVLDLERALVPSVSTQAVPEAVGGSPRRGTLQVRNLSFSYPACEPVLRNINLDIPAGSSLAIVGINGAGKSTLIKLVARLYEPSSGIISVDGVDVASLDATGWQRSISAVFQDFTQYPFTARQNVIFGRLEKAEDIALLAEVAALTGCADLVDHLSDGWDTALSNEGAGGQQLSGGQWQKLALARAMFAVGGGAGMLILDEPTASLDARAEAEIFDAVIGATRGITTLLVSHRFSTVRRADRICVLEAGEIAEYGTHEELLAANGAYAHAFATQASMYGSSESVIGN